MSGLDELGVPSVIVFINGPTGVRVALQPGDGAAAQVANQVMADIEAAVVAIAAAAEMDAKKAVAKRAARKGAKK